jgi:MFS family permease
LATTGSSVAVEPAKTGTTGLGHSLRYPAFRNLFASGTTSSLGAAISLVSVSWVVYHYTGSALDIAYLGLTGIVPGIALGLLAGVVADRYNRRSLMVTADLSRMVGMVVLTLFLYLAGFSLPVILAVMIFVNCFSALFTPASQAIVPKLVPRQSLEDANGLLQSTSSVAYSVGSAAGGILVVLFGAVWGLAVNALTYALSAVFLIQIAGSLGHVERDPSESRPSFRKDFSEGIGYVLGDRTLVEVSFGYLPSNFLSSFVSPFFVVYAASRFGGNAAVYGSLVAALAGGVAVGSLIVGRVRARPYAGVLMGLCLLVEGASWTTLAFSQTLAFSVAAAAAAGLAIGFANTVYYSTIQAVVPGHVLGRVMSIGDFGSFAAIPTGLVVGGLLIARYGVEPAFLVAGIGVLITGTTLLLLPDFRKFGRPRPNLTDPASGTPPPA